jgi:hypothetical protein
MAAKSDRDLVDAAKAGDAAHAATKDAAIAELRDRIDWVVIVCLLT